MYEHSLIILINQGRRTYAGEQLHRQAPFLQERDMLQAERSWSGTTTDNKKNILGPEFFGLELKAKECRGSGSSRQRLCSRCMLTRQCPKKQRAKRIDTGTATTSTRQAILPFWLGAQSFSGSSLRPGSAQVGQGLRHTPRAVVCQGT